MDIENFNTPLHIAIAEQWDMTLIKMFMTAEHIFKVDGGLHNCLHIAVSVVPYNSEVIEELLNMDVDANAQNWNGETPLHLAARNPLCDLNLVKMLVDNCANVNIKNKFLETPIFEFIRRCNEIDKCEEYFKIIQFLIFNEAELNIHNKNHDYPVHIAALLPSFINLKLVEEFSNYGADLRVICSVGDTLLHKVVRDKNNMKFVQFLIDEHPLFVVSRNNKGRTPLHNAVYSSSSKEIIKELIINGADVNQSDKEGNYPIHLVQSSPFCNIYTLIRCGTDVNYLNMYGRTPLMESILSKWHRREALQALIFFGARLNQTDVQHFSPLDHALSDENIKPEIIQLLLESGANPLNTHFVVAPPVYFCSKVVETAKIYIQYVLIHIFGNRKRCKKPCTELMRFDCYDDAMDKELSRFRDNCVDGLLLMKKDRLSKEITLYDFVQSECNYKAFTEPSPGIFGERILDSIDSENYKSCTFLLRGSSSQCNYRKVIDRSSGLFVRKILDRLDSENYKSCKFLLLGSIKERRLVEYIRTLKIYANKPVSTDAKQNPSTKDPKQSTSAQHSVRSIVLNIGSISHLVKFLDKKNLMNLALCFSYYQ